MLLWLVFPLCALASASSSECPKGESKPVAVPAHVASLKAGSPNILFILVDDLDEVISPYWKVLKKTRKLIADRGMRFTRTFAPTPICCPSRSSILTGLYAHNTRVLSNIGAYGGWEGFIAPRDDKGMRLTDAEGRCVNNENRTVAKFLHDAGYRTALIGKYLNGYDETGKHVPPGWSRWFVGIDTVPFYDGYDYTISDFNERDTAAGAHVLHFGTAPKDYQTDVVKKTALKFLDKQAGSDRPFFLMLTPTAPHLPMAAAPRHKKLAARWKGKLPKRPNLFEKNLATKPLWLRKTASERRTLKSWNETDFENRMGSLYAVDELVDEVISKLKRLGQLDNTLIVFASDNGYNLGSHNLIHKQAPYEESTRVPMVIAGPGVKKGSTDKLVLLMDLVPTFLELAGVKSPVPLDGRSLVPLLRTDAKNRAWRHDFMLEYLPIQVTDGIYQEIKMAPRVTFPVTPAFFLDVPPYKAIHDERYLLVEWLADKKQHSKHEFELYDVKRDPYELNNLVVTAPKASKKTFDRLLSRLKTLASCSGESCRR